MQLTDADVLDFQTMYKEQFGCELEWQEAQEQAIKLVRLMELAYRPMSFDELLLVQKQDTDESKKPTDKGG